ncbi:MAG: hypothetical protein QGF46_02205 [Planctomycetota bacterium]|nr:hypothetical protein [Planctomycetota bacterium]
MLWVNFTARVDGHPSDALSRRYGIRGFPTLMILDNTGKKAATPGGRNLAAFDVSLNALSELSSLNERKENGEVGLEASILLAELRLGQVELKDATKRREALKKPKEFDSEQWEADLVEVDALLFNLKVADMFQNAGRDRDKQAELSEKLYQFAKDGKFASGDMTYGYWSMVMEVARKKKDADIFRKGYEALYNMYKDEPRAEKFLQELKDELDAMQE